MNKVKGPILDEENTHVYIFHAWIDHVGEGVKFSENHVVYEWPKIVKESKLQ